MFATANSTATAAIAFHASLEGIDAETLPSGVLLDGDQASLAGLAEILENSPSVSELGVLPPAEPHAVSAPVEPDAIFDNEERVFTPLGLGDAWEITSGHTTVNGVDDGPVRIAILDQGVWFDDHFGDRLLPGWDAVLGRPTADVLADGLYAEWSNMTHGDPVAIAAAGAPNDGFTGYGACYACEILPVQVFGYENDDGAVVAVGGAYWGAISDGIDYAIANGADVINLSLGSDYAIPQPIIDIIKKAETAGVVVVASAGNGANPSSGSPASAPTAISVGAAYKVTEKESYSNFSHRNVDVTAPGMTAVWDPRNNVESSFNGTSNAGPFVAGVVGLIVDRFPEYTPAQVRERLFAFTHDPVNDSLVYNTTSEPEVFGLYQDWAYQDLTDLLGADKQMATSRYGHVFAGSGMLDRAIPTPTPQEAPAEGTFLDTYPEWGLARYGNLCSYINPADKDGIGYLYSAFRRPGEAPFAFIQPSYSNANDDLLTLTIEVNGVEAFRSGPTQYPQSYGFDGGMVDGVWVWDARPALSDGDIVKFTVTSDRAGVTPFIVELPCNTPNPDHFLPGMNVFDWAAGVSNTAPVLTCPAREGGHVGWVNLPAPYYGSYDVGDAIWEQTFEVTNPASHTAIYDFTWDDINYIGDGIYDMTAVVVPNSASFTLEPGETGSFTRVAYGGPYGFHLWRMGMNARYHSDELPTPESSDFEVSVTRLPDYSSNFHWNEYFFDGVEGDPWNSLDYDVYGCDGDTPRTSPAPETDPIDDDPVADDPIDENPVDDPVVDDPVMDDPINDNPVKDDPVDDPINDDPVDERPTEEAAELVEGSRLTDTRNADGYGLPGGMIRYVQVAGVGDVPADATAATVNFTVAGAAGWGYLTAWSCDSANSTVPDSSILNYDADWVRANTQTIGLGANGGICVWSYTDIDLLVDTQGFFNSPSVHMYTEPSRVADDRGTNGLGDYNAGEVRRIEVGNDAVAAFVNLTVVDAKEWGFLTAWPCESEYDSPPNASAANYDAGQTVANNALVSLNNGGFCVYSYGQTGVIVDLMGTIDENETSVVPLGSQRLVDTRTGASTIDGMHAGGGRIEAGQIRAFQITGRGNVPFSTLNKNGNSAGLSGVYLNVTSVNPQGTDGFLTIWACEHANEKVPNTSALNYNDRWSATPNSIVQKVNDGGQICIYAYKTTDVIVDVTGYVS